MGKNLFKKVAAVFESVAMAVMSITAVSATVEAGYVRSDVVNRHKAPATAYSSVGMTTTTTSGIVLQCTPSVVNVKAGERQSVKLSYKYGPTSYCGEYPESFTIEDESVASVVKSDCTWEFYVEGKKEGTTCITVVQQYGRVPLTTVLPVNVTAAEGTEPVEDDLSKTGIHIVIDNMPTHEMYSLGEQLDLSGGTFSVYFNGGGDQLETIYSGKSMTDYAGIDTSAFDNTKHGSYPITITYEHYTGYHGKATFYVNVVDPKQTAVIGNDATESTTTVETTGPNIEDIKPAQGDVDGNGVIDISDATQILEIYAQLAAEIEVSAKESTDRADINGDGMVDLTDATCLLNYYANIAAGLPCTWEDIIK